MPRSVVVLWRVFFAALLLILLAHVLGYSGLWYILDQPKTLIADRGHEMTEENLRHLRRAYAAVENIGIGLALVGLGSAMLLLSVLHNLLRAVFNPRRARWGTGQLNLAVSVFCVACLYGYLRFDQFEPDHHRGSPIITLMCFFVLSSGVFFLSWLALFFPRQYALIARMQTRRRIRWSK